MKKTVLILLILLTSTPLIAGGSSEFKISLKRELSLTTAAAATVVLGYYLKDNADIPINRYTWIDEGFNFPLNDNLDHLGDITSMFGVLSLPFLLDEFNMEHMLTIGIMYSEALLFTIGVKDSLKSLIRRPRPYVEDNISYKSNPDDFLSFPSGHTTMAFMTATFSSYIYWQGGNSFRSKCIFSGVSYSLAITTGVLRVVGGSHYVTDVITGAIIGTGIGLSVPLLHREKNLELNITYNSISLVYRM